MKQLKLKPNYEGVIITKDIFPLGKITFNAYTVKPKNYQNYKDFGFDIFDEIEIEQEIEQEIEYTLEIEQELEQDMKLEYKGIKQDTTDLETLSLKELRQLYPNIKSNSKKEFIKQII